MLTLGERLGMSEYLLQGPYVCLDDTAYDIDKILNTLYMNLREKAKLEGGNADIRIFMSKMWAQAGKTDNVTEAS